MRSNRAPATVVPALGVATVAAVLLVLVVIGASRFTGSNEPRSALASAFSASYGQPARPSGEVREFAIVADEASIELADGLEVDVWAYNGTVPGPALRVELGDSVVVEFENRLPQPTTVHWHGVRVPNAMDGVPGLTQPLIETGASFRYEFVPKDAGTFWFHAHHRGAEQLERGLYGSLVVTDPAEPAYDHDLVWVIDDWLLDSDGSLVTGFGAPSDVAHNGRWGNVVTTNGRIEPRIDIAPGSRVRLRLINASTARVVDPRFEGVDPRGIAVDGMLAREPFEANGFVLAPGNRVDVSFVMSDRQVVVTENYNGENYTIAVIKPGGAAPQPQAGPAPAPSNPSVPSAALAAGVGVDHEFTLDFLPDATPPSWGFNGVPLSAGGDPVPLESGSVSIIRLRNDSQALHPIHIHGQFFLVTSIDGVPVDEGHLRDTVLVPPGQVVDIALYASDEGTWLVHCHVQAHAEAGMAMLLDID